MAKQRHFHEGRTGRNDISRRLSDKKEREQLSGAQLELNRIRKKIAGQKEEIYLIPEKEERIKDFFERYAKPVFEKETALKYKYLVYLDEAYESGELTSSEKDTLLDLFAEESQGVEDFVTTDEQREHLLELKYKYDELMLGMSREELDQEAVEDTLSLFVNRCGIRPNKAMEAAKTEDELLTAISAYMKARDRRANAAAGEKATRAGKKTKEAGAEKVSKRFLLEQFQISQAIGEMKKLYVDMIKEFYKGGVEDEVRTARKEELLKQLAVDNAQKNLADILITQIEWMEEVAMAAPAEEKDLMAYNMKLRYLLICFDEQLRIIKNAPIPGVEGPYSQLRNFAWKDLPIQMNMLFTRHKKDMKGIEEYVSSVSTVSGLKSFLKRYGQTHGGGGFLGEDDWNWG
nr:J domain-containing protein [Parabacteroides goldsteinii]